MAALQSPVKAVGASACCVPVLAPLVVSLFGVSGSIWAASLTPYSLWIVLASGLVIGWAGWMIYRPLVVGGSVCKARPPRSLHVAYWIAVAFWILAFGLNVYYKWGPLALSGG